MSFNNSLCSVEQFLRNWLSTRLVTDETPGLVTGTYNTAGTEIDCHSLDVSALGESFDSTPMVLPIRRCLDSVKRLLKGDLYIGRGSRQRSLSKSRYFNTFKVSEVGREMAIDKFRETLLHDQTLYRSLWTLSGRRLLCHCRLHEKCHGDVLIQEFSNSYPQAYDRTTKAGSPADSSVLNYMSRLREEPDSEKGSSPDEGVPEKGAGHRGAGVRWSIVSVTRALAPWFSSLPLHLDHGHRSQSVMPVSRIIMAQRNYSLLWLLAKLLSARFPSKKFPFSIENFLALRRNMVFR